MLKPQQSPSVMRVAIAILRLFSVLAGVCIILGLLGLIIWHELTAPPLTREQQAAAQTAAATRSEASKQKREQREQNRLHLCRVAEACRNYDDARLQCATAGNFERCLRIKMGEDADYSSVCSGHYEGAPTIPLPPETPNRVQCFFMTLFH
jgi:hypothetical protein